MDTPQPPPIVNQTLKRKERSPSPARRTPGHTADSRPSPTSLPSIRHFLPQPDTTQLNERYHQTNNRQQTGPAFSAGPSAGIPRLDFLPPPPAQPPAERTHSGIIGDSDGDGDSEQAARPKQKRRRQALSCTECKRRKIKCDRAHPCTPCIRRGDQNKCQWHVIEPVDKYVSRAEYDELKARVDHLETLLSRPQLPSGFAPQPQQGPVPTSSSQAQPKPVSLPSTRLPAAAVPGQQQGCGVISTAPAPMPMPYNPIGLPPPPNSSPVGRTSSTTTATMTTTLTTLPSIASLANGPPPHSTGTARLHREHRDHEHREQQHQPYAPLPPPQSPLQQQQSLQLQLQQLRLQRLYQDGQQQTKNCHAQTFTPLGERLRCHHRIFLQGPAAVYRLYRLPDNNSNNSNIHRRLRRILMCGARRGRRTRAPTCRGHPHPERQRSGVQSVRRSENGSRVPIYPWLWTRRSRALRW